MIKEQLEENIEKLKWTLEEVIQNRRKAFLLYLLLITLIVLLAPGFTRLLLGNTTLMGQESHAHVMLAESLQDNDWVMNAVYEGRTFFVTPYHYIIAFLGNIIPLFWATSLFSLFLGVASCFLFLGLLKNLNISLTERLIIMLPLILSPFFIYLFSVATPHGLAICLLLFAAFLWTKTYTHKEQFMKHTTKIIAIISLVLVSTFSLFHSLLIILVIGIYAYCKRKELTYLFTTAGLIVLLAIFTQPLFYPTYYQIEQHLTSFITDLGAYTGFSVFYLVLVLVGLYESWKTKKRYYALYGLILLLAVMFFFYGNTVGFYLVFFLAYYAGKGLSKLRKMHWQFDFLKNLTLLVVICGLLFSSIAYINIVATMGSTNNMNQGLSLLQEYALSDDKIVSHHTNGFIIEHQTKRRTLLDGAFYTFDDLDPLFEAHYSIFYPKDTRSLQQVLEKHNIRFIVVDKAMKEDLWNNKKQGLLLLLENNKLFKKIYTYGDIGIWEVQKAN